MIYTHKKSYVNYNMTKATKLMIKNAKTITGDSNVVHFCDVYFYVTYMLSY